MVLVIMLWQEPEIKLYLKENQCIGPGQSIVTSIVTIMKVNQAVSNHKYWIFTSVVIIIVSLFMWTVKTSCKTLNFVLLAKGSDNIKDDQHLFLVLALN